MYLRCDKYLFLTLFDKHLKIQKEKKIIIFFLNFQTQNQMHKTGWWYLGIKQPQNTPLLKA